MRKPTDICLLCQVNPATKTKSHIFPKFLSTNFLGPKGTLRKGFELSSDKVLDKKPRVIQDSPKEDYILCEECEAYFSVLESIASQVFGNWQQKVAIGEFSLNKNKIINDLQILECNSAHKPTVHLFTYSIFWRVSISSYPLFKNFKITDDFEEELRQVLIFHRHTNKNDYLNALATNPNFKIYPWSVISAKSFVDDTANMLFAPFSYDHYCIVIDRFSFILFRTADDIKKYSIREFSNLQVGDCRMMILSQQLWHNIIVENTYNLLVKQAVENKRNNC
jgi:hypothetical protein